MSSNRSIKHLLTRNSSNIKHGKYNFSYSGSRKGAAIPANANTNAIQLYPGSGRQTSYPYERSPWINVNVVSSALGR